MHLACNANVQDRRQRKAEKSTTEKAPIEAIGDLKKVSTTDRDREVFVRTRTRSAQATAVQHLRRKAINNLGANGKATKLIMHLYPRDIFL